jgi:hypothetical protein
MARELSYYSYRDDAVLYHRAVPVLVYLGGFIAIVIIFAVGTLLSPFKGPDKLALWAFVIVPSMCWLSGSFLAFRSLYLGYRRFGDVLLAVLSVLTAAAWITFCIWISLQNWD